MEGICVNCLDNDQFFRVHSNQFCVVSKTQTTCDFCSFYTVESVLDVDDRSDFFFNISRDVAMATN